MLCRECHQREIPQSYMDHSMYRCTQCRRQYAKVHHWSQGNVDTLRARNRRHKARQRLRPEYKEHYKWKKVSLQRRQRLEAFSL